MINLVGSFRFRIFVGNGNRTIVTTSHLKIRTSDSLRLRRLRLPSVHGKLLKDSEFTDLETEEKIEDTSPGHIERAVDEYISEIKAEQKKVRKILYKKNVEKRVKEPSTLTFSEREHIKYLHKSDPNEWTPERLSESFPALPTAIRKILKSTWIPEKKESVIKHDNHVLENWEKMRRNELEASPELLDHLKKFVNKSENLRAQMSNPKFFPVYKKPELPITEKGVLAKFLLDYNRDVENLRNKSMNEAELLKIGETNVPVETEREQHRISLEEEIKMEAESRDSEMDNFLIGKPTSDRRQVTLDQMKMNILKKAEKKNKKPSQLSAHNQYLLNEALREKTNLIEVKDSEEDDDETVPNSQTVEKNYKLKDEISRERLTEWENQDGIWWNQQNMKKTNAYYASPKNNTRMLTANNVGLHLRKDKSPDKSPEVSEKIKKPPPNYYNTEKDKEMVERDHQLLQNTSFWNPKDKARTKSEDSAFEHYSAINKFNPHLAPCLQTHFTYNYPERIVIPREKWLKGMTYRVKDCYYDDDGEFLYRVPGLCTE